MLKRIPKKTKLLGWTITIEEVSQSVIDDLSDEPGSPGLFHAKYSDAKFTIYLAKEPSPAVKWETLWHEMGHAHLDIWSHDNAERE